VGLSLSFLLLSAAAPAQIRPNLPPDYFQPPSRSFLVPSRFAGSVIPLQHTSNEQVATPFRPRMGKAFWFGWGLAAAFSVASAEMTVRCERIAGCYEANPLMFTRKPSRLELYTPRAGIITAGMLISRHWKRRNPRDKSAAVMMWGVDAIWGADAGWDAYELTTIPKSAPARATIKSP